MSTVIIFALAVLVFLFAPVIAARRKPNAPASPLAVNAVRGFAALCAVYAILATSIVHIPSDKVGLVRKLYGFSSIPEGHIIATNGETGYQANIIPPGAFLVSPFYNVLNSVDEVDLVTVPQGFYGRIVANDGEALAPGQIMADAWPEKNEAVFLDAQHFLENHGKKGLQLSVLKPGTYPVNTALFQVKIGRAPNGRDITRNNDDVYDANGRHEENTPLDTSITRVPAGFVGVVRSSVQNPDAQCRSHTESTQDGGLVAELVPQGCKGIWDVSLKPNDYYLNKEAYDVTLVPTRVDTLEFKGGFSRRYIDLKVDAKGDFEQNEHSIDFPETRDAADTAVNTKIEGWQIPQELRAVVQITPENAPIVVAAVGGQTEVDQRIIVPSIRSIVRNVFGGVITLTELGPDGKPQTITRPTRVLDTVERRPDLEAEILRLAQVDGRRAGVDIKEIRLGESAIPPELLLARQRQQLAGQLKDAYEQERVAQEQRQQTEQARATADRQTDLVKAQIDVQTARLKQDQRQAEGHAERLFLEEQAAGQRAQTDVLGKDSVLKLQEIKLTLDLLAAHPEIVANLKLPGVFVAGQSQGGLEGAAAILGSLLKQDGTATAKPTTP